MAVNVTVSAPQVASFEEVIDGVGTGFTFTVIEFDKALEHEPALHVAVNVFDAVKTVLYGVPTNSFVFQTTLLVHPEAVSVTESPAQIVVVKDDINGALGVAFIEIDTLFEFAL